MLLEELRNIHLHGNVGLGEEHEEKEKKVAKMLLKTLKA